MTREELTQRILTALNDSPTDPVFWSLDEIHDTLAEGAELLAEEAQALRQTAYVARRSGVLFYTLGSIASDIMAITRVWLPDTHERLEATTMTALGRTRWLDEPGAYPRCWYPVGWHAFGIYPAPAQGQGLMELDYLQWPAALLDDDDEPAFPEPDQDSLVTYGVYMGLMKSWDVVRAQDLFQQFMARWSDATGRNGTRELQARSWQRSTRR